MVVALQVAGKEEVGAKGGDILWQVPNGDVEVPVWGQGYRASPRRARGHEVSCRREGNWGRSLNH